MRRAGLRVVALLTSVASVSAVAGCGSDPGVARAAYAHEICTALASFETSLSATSATLQAQSAARSQSLATTRTQVLALLTRQSAASSSLQNALRVAGRPKGSDGPAIARTFTGAAQQVQDVFSDQRTAIENTSSADPAAFYAALTTTSAQLGDADTDLLDALEQVGDTGDDALNGAFAADGTCSSL